MLSIGERLEPGLYLLTIRVKVGQKVADETAGTSNRSVLQEANHPSHPVDPAFEAWERGLRHGQLELFEILQGSLMIGPEIANDGKVEAGEYGQGAAGFRKALLGLGQQGFCLFQPKCSIGCFAFPQGEVGFGQEVQPAGGLGRRRGAFQFGYGRADWIPASELLQSPGGDSSLLQVVGSGCNVALQARAGPGHKYAALGMFAEERPLALALPGQGVVLGQGGLELCYEDGERSSGDARLALLLGHELAHLEAEEDVHAFAAYQPESGTELIEAVRNRAPDLGEREIRADQRGLVYAAMAGFDPEILFNDGEAFFRRWVSRPVASAAYDSHPSPQQRARFLMGELSRIAAELDYFHYGLRFYQMGRYEEAISLLAHSQSLYPSREVLNNLGLAELQIALQHLAACDGALAMRFRLPLVMDAQTLSEGVRRRGGQSQSCLEVPLFRQHFSAAVTYFRKALGRDPEHLSALLNLFSSRVVGGEAAAALDLAERASALSGQDPSVLSARAVAIYLFAEDKDLQKDRLEAIGLLREQTGSRPEAGLAYNLAVMLSESGLPAEAAWRRFLDLEAIGPYADYARERLGRADAPSTALQADWEAPLPLGPIGPTTRLRLEAMTSKELPVSAARTLTAFHDSSVRVLTENDRVLLVEERLLSPVALDTLAAQQQAWRRITTTRGQCLVGNGRMLETTGNQVVKRIWFE